MIYAWRAWRIGGEPVWTFSTFTQTSTPRVERWVPYLQSITTTTGNVWETPGPVTATCDMGRITKSFGAHTSHDPDTAPAPRCTCGIWGTSTLQQPMEYAHSPWIVAGGNITIFPPGAIPASWTTTTATPSGASAETNTWTGLSGNPFVVIGVAAFWGRVIRHETGLRAQHAQIVALAETFGTYHQELSQRYNIPVLPTVSALAEEYKLPMSVA